MLLITGPSQILDILLTYLESGANNDFKGLMSFISFPRLGVLGLVLLCQVSAVWAAPSLLARSLAPEDCSRRAALTPNGGVLYKPINEHGGRGPSFLVQNTQERTGKRSLQIRSADCKVIGRLGLWAVDFPYGARYYSKVKGGSSDNHISLWRKARRAGSELILIEGRGRWLEVPSPKGRAGGVNNG